MEKTAIDVRLGKGEREFLWEVQSCKDRFSRYIHIQNHTIFGDVEEARKAVLGYTIVREAGSVLSMLSTQFLEQE